MLKNYHLDTVIVAQRFKNVYLNKIYLLGPGR